MHVAEHLETSACNIVFWCKNLNDLITCVYPVCIRRCVRTAVVA